MRDRLLELLEQTRKPVSVRELVQRLELSGGERRELKALLRRLIEDGEVVKIRGARIGLPARMSLVVGRLSCSPSGYGFVVPERPDDRQGDVYIAGANLKQALHGDRVVARIERVTAKGREGRIIRILERALGHVVGRYEDDGRFGGHVIPFDRRVLHEVFIPAGDAQGVGSGVMVKAELTRPPTATRNPVGRVVQVIGRLDEPGVDLKVVMAKHGLPDDFPEEVTAEAARVPREVGDADRAGREDYRDLLTVTIDPKTARDHDDAISVERLGSGGWRLFVHIADVAHYVPEGSLIDQEAYLRGTSVYFPDRVVPMLPETLSSHICSLVEGQDRLTQTVVLELDRDGRVQGSSFHDGVIRSAARLAYGEVQAVLDGEVDERRRLSRFSPLLEEMAALAGKMRRRRHARGSLDLELPEPELVLDGVGELLAIRPSPRLFSQRLIEEFMLAANEAVAQRLSEAGVETLFRVHERPDPERLEEFRELAETFGYRLPDNLEQVRPEDFQLILRQIEGKPEQKLISYLLLRTMKLARYHEENLGHFGLATAMYAHFTSPIRRYPDLVAHRALRALRAGAGVEAGSRPIEALPEMGVHLSKTEQTAAEAERELIEWKKVRFMAGRLGETFRGYVTGVQAFGLFVELDEIYVQGLVHVSSMSDDYYRFNEKAHCLIGEDTRHCYRLGDHVEVQVARVDLERRQIDFALVDVLERAATRRRAAPRPRTARRRPRRT